MNDIFKVYDFENEQQWLKGRMNGIGGSDASAVVGMNPYKSNIDLFEERWLVRALARMESFPD